MRLKIKKLSEKAKLPIKHNPNDAAFDLHSLENLILPSSQTKIIHTGVCMEIPKGYYGQIESRSSMAAKGIFVTGGVIDSGYRGEIMIITNNFSSSDYTINEGERIAQIVFHKVKHFDLLEVEAIDEENDRGGGLGSSGL